jgi:hypothetical protein
VVVAEDASAEDPTAVLVDRVAATVKDEATDPMAQAAARLVSVPVAEPRIAQIEIAHRARRIYSDQRNK